MTIFDLEKWKNNEFYVAMEHEGNTYYYVLTCNDNYEVTHYMLLPEDYDEETDEAIFSDEYKETALQILDDVVNHFEVMYEFSRTI